MPFTWNFYTGTHGINPVGRRCHRGPMIDVERVMAAPFQHVVQFNTLRKRLLDNIVDTTLLAVQTREILLRAINSPLGPMFLRLAPRKKALQVIICEKLRSPVIEQSLSNISPFYASAAQALYSPQVPQQQVDLLLAALGSNSPVLRVAGKCSTILLASFVELDAQNG